MNTYTLQKKAAPFPPPGAAPGDEQAPEDAPTIEETSKHEWAGDLYEADDVTDPAAAFASFTGVEGESAWLDRSDDGTVTGWIEDADGSVYRYTDADAWVVDVEQAGMTRVDPAEQQVEGDGEAEPAVEAGGELDAAAEPLGTEDPEAPLEDPAEEIGPDAPAPGDDADPVDPPDPSTDPEDPEEEEDEEGKPKTPWEKKSLSYPHASGSGRIVISPR